MTKQVKSRQRVADHGEVFTAEREVNAMLDLVKQETDRVYSRFLEPACGDGNFVAEILRRKLEAAKKRAIPPRKKKPLPLEFEKQSVIAVASIYGVDLLIDNVIACRQRLYDIFMLRNLSSPETYFQAAFRVQSPWEITKDNGECEIVRQECYVFDFALDRALRQISDYSCRLNVAESNPEKKVGEFINFLPVLAYDGSAMHQVNAAEILDIAMAGTSATLLAKRWESALLVNVDNDTLARLLASEEAMDALMRIEGFLSLNADIETIINKSNAVKKAKRDGEKLTPKEKKELTDAEKEYKSKRKMIQEKLIKFATRVPVFMYLTDYREYSLQDVITQLEPELFKKVTGLDVKDFELLVSLNVFNEALMNDAVYKFKRYEAASLIYTGIDKHTGENVGLYSTVISRADYDAMAGQLAASMTADAPRDDDIPERPVFTNISSYDLDDDEEDLPMVAEPKAKYETKRKPLVEPSKPVSTPTYRPSYVPPTPSVTPVTKKPTVHIDTSKVHAGTIVSHKEFGPGQVKGVDGGLIVVTFAGVDKKFQFPGAFEQGFLKLGE